MARRGRHERIWPATCAVVLLLTVAVADSTAADFVGEQPGAEQQPYTARRPQRQRRLLAASTACAGCLPGFCLPATGCSACDDDAGYSSNGFGACTKGDPEANARTATPSFALHPLLSSNGVIAAGGTGAVFGFAPRGSKVSVRLLDSKGRTARSASATANSANQWLARLGSLKASNSVYSLQATLGKKTVKSTNIVIGQLWLAAGQSNAYISLGDIASYSEPWRSTARKALSAASGNKSVRLFRVPTVSSSSPRTTVSSKWTVPSYSVVNTFSALGYLTGLQLQQATRAPVGIVQSSYGGTSIVQWIPPAVLKSLRVPSTSRTAASKNLFNTMVAPLAGAEFTGVTWYQGESDGGLTFNNPLFAFYQQLLTALLSSWRSALLSPKLAFEIVQLPAYAAWYSSSQRSRQNLNHWPYVREAQLQVAARDSRADLVAAIDVGDPNNVHPPNKWDVAARLVRAIRKNRMGVRVADAGPNFRKVSYSTRQARVYYNDASGGLVVGTKANNVGGVSRQSKTAGLSCFELYYNKRWYPATGRVSGTSVIVTASSKIGRPSGVRYAWSDAPKCNLYSSVLLPAVPFTTDRNYAVAARMKYG